MRARPAAPGLGRLLMAAALGGAMALGQAPFGLWFVTVFALAGVIALVARQDRGAGWIGFCAGAGYFVAALNWVVEPFLVEADVYGWMAPFALVLLSCGLALFWAAAAWIGPWFGGPLVRYGRKSGDLAGRGFGFALALTVAEMLRGHVLTGFPWAMIGHVWIGHPPAQVAALAGPAGLTVLAVFAAWALAQVRLVPIATGVLAVGAAFAFGLWRLEAPAPAPTGAVVRLVQPNAEQAMKWDPVQADVFFRRLLDFTRAAPESGGARPDLVIWPETAVPYLLEDYPEVAVEIAAAGAGVPVATGVQRAEGWRFWNSLAVIGPGGAIGARYDKHHLVPFGEYIPFGDLAYRWFGLTAFAAQEGNGYSAGSGPAVIDLGPKLGKALPIICYEAVFPQDLRAAPERAGWILQITNDAWFGTLTGPYQHLAQAELRSIEQGLPMLRVANTGITGVIDARGRMGNSLGLGEAGFLDVALPGALPPTPYVNWGDGPLMVLLAGVALMLWLRRGRLAA